MKKALAAVCLLIAPIQFAQANFITGNELYEFFRKGRDSALTYVAGVTDTIDAIKTEVPERVDWCVPKNAALHQYGDVVEKYLREHPQHRHFSASSLIMKALREAFPCRR
jgi:hypothetical protein